LEPGAALVALAVGCGRCDAGNLFDIWRSAGRFDPSQGSDKVFIAMIARRR